ncbi:MAG: CoA-acylating methylmalonate-semialdehyde dehydrogenase, partial [Gammaproteobacteria bacterium]
VCGNCFILKPSERDPSSTLYIAELLHEAGLPKGVLNVVNGNKEAVDTLLHDPRIEAVSFVGSTPIAEYIYSTATANGKRCQALGGAKNHAIVMPDADVDNTVNQLLGAAFGSSGERCMALSVAIVVGDETGNTFISKMKEVMKNLKIGAYTDSTNDFGPLITGEHRDKVTAYIDSAEEQGATIVVDGRGIKVKGYENGFFLGATLIDNVTPNMVSYKEEIFGPVLQVVRASNMQEAMDIIDNHEYGNGTCIFTRDGEAARYFSDHIKVGMVGINIPLPVPVSYHSFGGWKRSLFGDLFAYGPDGVRFYTRRKTITQRWPSAGIREGKQFSMPTMK